MLFGRVQVPFFTGMWRTTDEEGEAFAQDLAKLATVTPAVNRGQKSDMDPADWMSGP